MASPTTTRTDDRVAAALVRFLETGTADPGLFAPDVFCDFTLPTWRLQSAGRAATVALRTENHPSAEPGDPPPRRPRPTGASCWSSRRSGSTTRARPGTAGRSCAPTSGPRGSSSMAVYCTGDWDPARIAEHAAAVEMIRP